MDDLVVSCFHTYNVTKKWKRTTIKFFIQSLVLFIASDSQKNVRSSESAVMSGKPDILPGLSNLRALH